MNISVLGCGRWGSFIGWYLANHGNNVYQWGREGATFDKLYKTRKNEYVSIDERITLTSNLEEAISHAEIIVISISAQSLRDFMQSIVKFDVKDKIFVLCMKGIEIGTGKRLSEVVEEYIRYLACGIINLINIFQPEILSIGGGVCNEGDYLLDPVKEIVAKEIYTCEGTEQTDIRIAKLGNDAGIIGAAALCSK